MKVWLVMEGEELPTDGENVRLLRIGILADMLVKRGHEVVWWTSTFSHARKVQRYECDTILEVAEGYSIQLMYARPYRKNISFARIKHQKEVAKKFLLHALKQEKPDLILVGMPTIDLAETAVQYGKHVSVPVIVDIRDLWPDMFSDFFPKCLSPLIRLGTHKMNKQLCATLNEATGIVGITEPFLEWGLHKANRGRNEKDAVYPLAYRGQLNNIDSESVLASFNLSKNNFIVLYSGAVANASNLQHVINAAKILQNDDTIRFVILGNGDKLESFQATSSNLPNICFPGRVDREVLSALASSASAGLLPYRKKTQYSLNIPNKFIEYLYYGLPILLLTDGIMLKTINEHHCGMSYDNSMQLAECVCKMKENRKLHYQMKQNARLLFDKNFDASLVYNEMMKYLEKLTISSENGLQTLLN